MLFVKTNEKNPQLLSIACALFFQALQAARIHTDIYLCDKAMRNILSYQDEEGSFGTILANIRVTPALLGESLIGLKNLACPVGKQLCHI